MNDSLFSKFKRSVDLFEPLGEVNMNFDVIREHLEELQSNSNPTIQNKLLECEKSLDFINNYKPHPNSLISAISDSLPQKPLRILYVCGAYPSFKHAGGLRIFDILNILTDRHQVDLISGFNPELDEDSRKELGHKFGKSKLFPIKNIDSQDITSWVEEQTRINGLYDVIQFEYVSGIPYLEKLKPFTHKTAFTFMECFNRRFIIDFNGLNESSHSSATLHFLHLYTTISELEHKAIEGCDLLIALTERDKQHIQHMNNYRTPLVLPTGLSERYLLNDLPDDFWLDKHIEQMKSVAYIGFYGHPPNLDAVKWFIRKAHPIIRKEIPDYQFNVYGGGAVDAIKKICDPQEGVQYVGFIESIAKELIKNRICIAPLVSGAGFRGKVNQYAAIGRPTVSTSIGVSGLPYEIGKDIFVADDPEVFAQKIIDLLKNNDLWEKMRKNFYDKCMKHFAWSNLIKELERMYNA